MHIRFSKFDYEYTLNLALYTMLFFVVMGLGYRIVVPYGDFQFLDKVALRERLWESLWYLHSQPPVLNFLLGLLLKIEAATGISLNTLLSPLQFALGGGIVVGLTALSRILLHSRILRRIFMAIVLLNPAFFYFLFVLSYTSYELGFVTLLGVVVWWYIRKPSLKHFAFMCIAVVLLVYTRAPFHFVWGIMVLIALLWVKQSDFASGHEFKRAIALGSVTFTILLLWAFKNLILFNVFGYSSWEGLNVARRLPVNSPEIAEIFTQRRSLHIDEMRKKVQEQIPLKFRSIPVLAEPVKSKGFPNWNFYVIIPYARTMGHRALHIMISQPEALLKKIALNYLSYTQFSGRHPYSRDFFLLTMHPVERFWARMYELLVMQEILPPISGAHPDGFFFIFPVIICLAMWKTIKIWKSRHKEALFVAFLLSIILWVFLLVLLVDGEEGNRIRYPTTPLIFLLLLWLIPYEVAKGGQTRAES